jgi:hypothetical protein
VCPTFISGANANQVFGWAFAFSIADACDSAKGLGFDETGSRGPGAQGWSLGPGVQAEAGPTSYIHSERA